MFMNPHAESDGKGNGRAVAWTRNQDGKGKFPIGRWHRIGNEVSDTDFDVVFTATTYTRYWKGYLADVRDYTVSGNYFIFKPKEVVAEEVYEGTWPAWEEDSLYFELIGGEDKMFMNPHAQGDGKGNGRAVAWTRNKDGKGKFPIGRWHEIGHPASDTDFDVVFTKTTYTRYFRGWPPVTRNYTISGNYFIFK
jgi:hypothetical protein